MPRRIVGRAMPVSTCIAFSPPRPHGDGFSGDVPPCLGFVEGMQHPEKELRIALRGHVSSEYRVTAE